MQQQKLTVVIKHNEQGKEDEKQHTESNGCDKTDRSETNKAKLRR